MISIERQNRIRTLLEGDGRIEISAASRALGVSEMTIRRDLRVLEEQGVLVRVHGGAMPSGPGKFGQRQMVNRSGKRRAARKLEKFIPERGCVYLDGSTTIYELARLIGSARGLRIVTNNIETLRMLESRPGVHPLLIGGELDARTDNLVGPVARRALAALCFDAAFFSCYGIDCGIGAMEITLEDAEVKEIVAERSRATYTAVDTEKFQRTGAGAWRAPTKTATLATELDPDDERVRPFEGCFNRIL